MVSTSDPAYFALALADWQHLQPGQVVQDGDLGLVSTRPRTLRIDIDMDGVPGVELFEGGGALAHLTPQGEVSPSFLAGVDPTAAAKHDFGHRRCEAGWLITKLDPDLRPILGPQADQILLTARRASSHLVYGTPEQTIYRQAQQLMPSTAAWQGGPPQGAAAAAVKALESIGADGHWWWADAAFWNGPELLAEAARDLLDSASDWNPDAYAELTNPWRIAFDTPLSGNVRSGETTAQLPAASLPSPDGKTQEGTAATETAAASAPGALSQPAANDASAAASAQISAAGFPSLRRRIPPAQQGRSSTLGSDTPPNQRPPAPGVER